MGNMIKEGYWKAEWLLVTALLWMDLGLRVSSIGPWWKPASWYDNAERWGSLEGLELSKVVRSEKLSQRRLGLLTCSDSALSRRIVMIPELVSSLQPSILVLSLFTPSYHNAVLPGPLPGGPTDGRPHLRLLVTESELTKLLKTYISRTQGKLIPRKNRPSQDNYKILDQVF